MSGAPGTRNLRNRYYSVFCSDVVQAFRPALHRADLKVRTTPAVYQSNFVPKRKSRGGMILDGVVNVAPELQLMFCAALLFVRL